MRSHSEQSVEGVRIGLFGLLGSGNIGNDASMEAVLDYLQARHPSAVIDVMCSGPERVTAEYGLDAVQMFWFDQHQDRLSHRPWNLLRVPSRILDVFRVSGWVHRHDVVIVPGAGVLEASLPLRPWNTPYGLFLLTASGRLFRTKVALVCVGAGPINKRATRTLSNWAARLAAYRSYRDGASGEAMRRRGLESRDSVFPDLAFSLPTPGEDRLRCGDWSTIGIGVMAYSGSNDDRHRARDVYRAYVGLYDRVGVPVSRRCPQGASVHWGHRRVRQRDSERNRHRCAGAAPRFGRDLGHCATCDDLSRNHGSDGAPRSDHCNTVPQSHRCAQTRQADDRHRLLRTNIAT